MIPRATAVRALGRGLALTAGLTAGLAAALLASAVPPAAAATSAAAAGGTAATTGHDGPVRPDLITFRVDVSRYPRIGMVVTAPGTAGQLDRNDFLVLSGPRAEVPAVRKLSPGDIELMLAPDAAGGPARTRPQWTAAARFLAGLPAGARTGVADPNRPAVVAVPLNVDPAPAVLDMTTTAPDAAPGATPAVAPVPAADRLAASLSTFTRGSRVRRTIVLALTADEALSRAEASRFAQQLAASGTALYVLDAAPRADRGYDALADASGGGAFRVRHPADWAAAFGQITGQLSRQYYLRFNDPRPLPGQVQVVVRIGAGAGRATTALPAANPVAPPPVRVRIRVPAPPWSWDAPFVGLAALLIVIGVGYGLGMLAISRREPRWPGRRRRLTPGIRRVSTDGLFFVFLMPCLNEEKVLPNSLRRLLSITGGNFAIMVIDDGSDDGTVRAIADQLGDRVWLLSRQAPEARQGKGEALNAAIRYLTSSGLLDGYAADDVITVVVDADGRLDTDAIAEVTPYFADPTVGAVQIGVRINNRDQSRLARMQDIEFVVYTEVFQRGRRHLGSVGLGGNGQFVRLSALLSLGGGPWTRSLTDDLDLGVRLIAGGWRNEYCPRVAVHQQGVVELRRLVRQRSRWFQGHLQSWKLIPLVLRRVPRRARTDLFYHLTSPAILLIASLLSASFVVSLVNCAGLALHGRNPLGWWVISTYALTFGPALVYCFVYWTRERAEGVSLLRAVWFAHLYVCYGMMWYASGWWAVGRTLRGRTGWAKTDRVAEAPVAAPVPAPAAPVAAALPAPRATSATDVAATVPLPIVPLLTAAPPAPLTWPAPLTRPAPRLVTAVPRPRVNVPPAAPTTPLPMLSTPSGPPAPSGPDRRRKRWPVAVAAVIAVAALATGLSWPGVLSGGGPSPWLTAFNGYGRTSVAGSGSTAVIGLAPATTRTPQVTHAALVVSKPWYSDFAATAQVRTLRQLRSGAAGQPHPWEVAWLVWHYDSDQRFYALTLEAGGWVLSKQDPGYPGGEHFLASGRTPRFHIGAWHRVGIVQVGNQITLTADGQLLTRYTDTQRPYLNGAFGLYSEDAVTQFTGIRLHGLAGR